MKRPSFQFYPSDWLRDTALRSCSIEARGLWMDMICYMHEGNPYGHLKVNHKVILPTNLARMVGLSANEVEGLLDELVGAGVCQVADDGCYFSRRMVKDEKTRQLRAEGGKKGGNPALKVKQDGVGRLTSKDNQNPTPSSSSSSSSSELSNDNSSGGKDGQKQKSSMLVEDFSMPDPWIVKAQEKGMTDATARLEFEKFKLHHIEAKTKSESWARQWSRWCLNWVSYGGRQVGAAKSGGWKSEEYNPLMDGGI